MLGSVFYEALIDALGTQVLGDVILAAADAEIGVEEVFGYWLEDNMAPVCIASSGRIGSSLSRATSYADQYHQLDPLNWMADGLQEGEPTRFGRVTAIDIEDRNYRQECFDRPGLSEKLSFARRRGTRRFVLSFYRARDRRRTGHNALGDLAEIVLPLLGKQIDLLGDELAVPAVQRVERRLKRTFPALTRREIEVCARTMIGMTAEAISLDLGIGETTTLTYRRRAYERYKLSSASEMVGKILT